MTPEARARQTIDTLLAQAAWLVCDMAQANIHAAVGVAIPEADRGAVRAAIERVLDSAFRETPTSVIDQCRNAMTVVLSRWLRTATGNAM